MVRVSSGARGARGWWVWASGGARGKFDLRSVPPWKRWPKSGPLSIHTSKLPEVTPPIDILACTDTSLIADAISEVVPWKRKWAHHPWLHDVCGHVRALVPQMAPRDIVRITLAFGELYTKRKHHTLLFNDFETFTLLFQSLPIQVVTKKTIVPLLWAYRRMDIRHETFVRAACQRVASGEVELEPAELVETIRVLGYLRIKHPPLFELTAETLDYKFAYFSEDMVGDIARTFVKLKYRCLPLFEVFRRELPYRLHEYAWWNLIDIGEAYLELEVNEPDIMQRIGNETFKMIYSMKYNYPAKALKVLAHLEVGDKRTYRALIRTLPRRMWIFSAQTLAETIIACATINVEPSYVYHRLRGGKLYRMLTTQLISKVKELTAKTTCDVWAALANVGQREPELAVVVESLALARPWKFHSEHLISLLRDYGRLGHKSTEMRFMLVQRSGELQECTPSALAAIPSVLAAHDRRGTDASEDHDLLTETSRLLCQPGSYSLPADARIFRHKDAFWWQQLRQRHFRIRRKMRKANAAVEPAPEAPDSEDPATAPGPTSAVAHITQAECLQLVRGSELLLWRDELVLDGLAQWLCEGRRHADLGPSMVADLLGAFSTLDFTKPLLRAALEHALVRVAPELHPSDCTKSLRGAIDLGMSVRSDAVRSLVRRCTSQLALVPVADLDMLRVLCAEIRNAAVAELMQSGAAPGRGPIHRLPLEHHLFSEALAARTSGTFAVHAAGPGRPSAGGHFVPLEGRPWARPSRPSSGLQSQ